MEMNEQERRIARSKWPVRIGRLEEEDEPDPIDPSEAFERMWQLTMDAWVFKQAGDEARGEQMPEDELTDESYAQSQFQRHVVRILRPQG